MLSDMDANSWPSYNEALLGKYQQRHGLVTIWVETATVMKTGTWVSPHYVKQYTLNVRSPGKQLVLFSKSPDVSQDEVLRNIRTRGKTKLTGFPSDPYF